MRLLDKPRFSKMLIKLSKFWTKEITDDLQDIWWDALKDYDIETIALACRIIAKDRKKKEGYPNPADIIETIKLNPNKTSPHKALPAPVFYHTKKTLLFQSLNAKYVRWCITIKKEKTGLPNDKLWDKDERNQFVIEHGEGAFNEHELLETEKLINSIPDNARVVMKDEDRLKFEDLITSIVKKGM